MVEESKERVVLIYHGAIDRARGIEELLKVLEQNKSLYLVLLGNGEEDYLTFLRNLANNLGVDEKVYFHPAVQADEIWKYVGAADISMVLIQPAVKSYYLSLPNKLFESIQSLTPIIASDFPEIKKIIDNYKVGMTCDPKNIEAVNECIIKMIENKSLNNIYKNNLLYAKEELCWEKEQLILEKALKEKISSSSSVVAVKLVMNDFSNASRDRREVDVMQKLGWDVTVIYPFQKDKKPCDSKYKYVNLKKVRLNKKQNFVYRKLLIIRNEMGYLRQIRKIHADVISCHDIDALRVAWVAYLGKKRPLLIYDSHEFELERYRGKKRNFFLRNIIALEEKILMKQCVFSMMVNDSIAEEVQRIHKLPEKPIVIRNIPYKSRIEVEVWKNIRKEFNDYFNKLNQKNNIGKEF